MAQLASVPHQRCSSPDRHSCAQALSSATQDTNGGAARTEFGPGELSDRDSYGCAFDRGFGERGARGGSLSHLEHKLRPVDPIDAAHVVLRERRAQQCVDAVYRGGLPLRRQTGD